MSSLNAFLVVALQIKKPCVTYYKGIKVIQITAIDYELVRYHEI